MQWRETKRRKVLAAGETSSTLSGLREGRERRRRV
jgi:hypothetical protein